MDMYRKFAQAKLKRIRLLVAAVGVLAFFSLMPVASATVIGHLDVANCTGGGVTVTAATITWLPAVDATHGCIQTGTGTNITYAGGGPLVPGVTGSILDEPDGLNLDFMTFMGNPSLHFDLTGIGPGPGNTNCAGLALFQSCAVFAGSPFALELIPGGTQGTQTAVTLTAFGVARDASASISDWFGAFSTQLSNLTPAQVQAIILGGGSVTSTYSGDFSITAVPEPLSFLMIGGGLVAVALLRKRKARI